MRHTIALGQGELPGAVLNQVNDSTARELIKVFVASLGSEDGVEHASFSYADRAYRSTVQFDVELNDFTPGIGFVVHILPSLSRVAPWLDYDITVSRNIEEPYATEASIEITL